MHTLTNSSRLPAAEKLSALPDGALAQLLRTALEQTANSAFITDAAGCIVWVNPAFTRLTGYSQEEAIGHNPKLLKSGRQSAEWYRSFWNTIASGKSWVGRNVNRHKNGTLFDVQQTVTPLVSANGEVSHYLSIHEDISAQVQTETQMRQMALHDALTGLPNRPSFQRRLDEATARARRNGQQLAVLLLDLDHFKHVNDTLGHAAGDELLMQVGQRITRQLREVDLAARLGGDEFAILLENLGSPEQASEIANRILAAVSQPYDLKGNHAHVGASIGVALHSDDAQQPDELMKTADQAMYRAKSGGRNRCELG